MCIIYLFGQSLPDWKFCAKLIKIIFYENFYLKTIKLKTNEICIEDNVPKKVDPLREFNGSLREKKMQRYKKLKKFAKKVIKSRFIPKWCP